MVTAANVKSGAIDITNVTEAMVNDSTAPAPALTLDVNALSNVKPRARTLREVEADHATKAPAKAAKATKAPAKAAKPAPAPKTAKAPTKAPAKAAKPAAEPRVKVGRGAKVAIAGVGQHCMAAELDGGRVQLPLGGIAWEYTQRAWLTGKDAKLRTLAKALTPFTPKGAGQAGPVAYLTISREQATSLAYGLWQAAPIATPWEGMANAAGTVLAPKAAQALLRKRLRQHARAVAGRLGIVIDGDALTEAAWQAEGL